MNVLNEIDINARFTELCRQREVASNHAVNLTGVLAVAQGRVKELDAQLSTAQERIQELENRLAESKEPPAAQEIADAQKQDYRGDEENGHV